jgi:flagellar motor switch protein FliN/FliY
MNEVLVAPIELTEAFDVEPMSSTPLIKRSLSMLGHVNVQLRVDVGHAEMSVEKLFALAQGDVVALDTHLDAPVTLQLDGKAIAHGHLVAVGDSFGLRISEIL